MGERVKGISQKDLDRLSAHFVYKDAQARRARMAAYALRRGEGVPPELERRLGSLTSSLAEHNPTPRQSVVAGLGLASLTAEYGDEGLGEVLIASYAAQARTAKPTAESTE